MKPEAGLLRTARAEGETAGSAAQPDSKAIIMAASAMEDRRMMMQQRMIVSGEREVQAW